MSRSETSFSDRRSGITYTHNSYLCHILMHFKEQLIETGHKNEQKHGYSNKISYHKTVDVYFPTYHQDLSAREASPMSLCLFSIFPFFCLSHVSALARLFFHVSPIFSSVAKSLVVILKAEGIPVNRQKQKGT